MKTKSRILAGGKLPRFFLKTALLLLTQCAAPVWAVDPATCDGRNTKSLSFAHRANPVNWNTPVPGGAPPDPPASVSAAPVVPGVRKKDAGVSVALDPNGISSQYNGFVQLTIDGLQTNETVRVEKFQVNNTNGVVDDGALMVQSFTLTDGVDGSIGGQPNVSVPADLTPADAMIVARLSFVDLYDTHVAARYVYRVSSPTARFAPACADFVVTNNPVAQFFTGQVSNGGKPVSYAYVVLMSRLLEGTYGVAAGTVADADGRYTLGAEPGIYEVVGIKPGMVGAFGLDSERDLPPSGRVTHDLQLRTPTERFSGQVTDDNNPPTPLPAVQLYVHTWWNEFTIAYTDANGRFSVPIDGPVDWVVQVPVNATHQKGYAVPWWTWVDYDDPSKGRTNNQITLFRGAGLISGYVKNTKGEPLTRARVVAFGRSETILAFGITDTNGYYTITAPPGAWKLQADSLYLGTQGYLGLSDRTVSLGSGQAVGSSFPVQNQTAAVQGTVVDAFTDAPWLLQQVQIIDGDGNYTYDMTGFDGTFNLGVKGGEWTIFLPEPTWESTFFGLYQKHAVVADGATLDVLNLPARNSDFMLFVSVHDNLDQPVDLRGLQMLAASQTNGASYLTENYGFANGELHLDVFQGDWLLKFAAPSALAARGYVAPLPLAVSVTNNSDANVDITLQCDPPRLVLWPVADSRFTFRVGGVASAQYIVQASPDLVTWGGISTNTASALGTFEFSEPMTAGVRFYRVWKQ